VVQQGAAGPAAAVGIGSAADLVAAGLDAVDLPGFSVSTEQATDYPAPGAGQFMILAQYAADWITDPANSSGVSDIYVALSLHSTTDDAAALLTDLSRSMVDDPDLASMQAMGPQGLGDASMSASITVQHAGEPAQQLFGVAFRRGSVSVLVVGGGSLELVAAYGQIVDQRLAAAGA
jgi:hypothetical protein